MKLLLEQYFFSSKKKAHTTDILTAQPIELESFETN